MARTQFAVRFDDTTASDAAWTRGRHRPRGVPGIAEPGRGTPPARPHRVGRGAVACDAGTPQPFGRDRNGPHADLRRGGRGHRGQGGRRCGAEAPARWARTHRCCASRTCRRSRRPARRTSGSASTCGADEPRRLFSGSAGVDRQEELARMMAGGAITPSVLASARELLASRDHQERGESEAEAKGESESRKAKGRK